MSDENDSKINAIVWLHDVAIIGAGPCGLAVAARLCEPTPSALFTDDEHARYHWLNKHGKRTSLKDRRTGQIRVANATSNYSPMQSSMQHSHSILVLDSSSDQWMANWKRLFEMLDISHLRSPMFFHIDPADRDSLLAHTHECKREGDLLEICNCVGKEISKNKRKGLKKSNGRATTETMVEVDERDRKDYYTPSSSLFTHHCDKVIDRYKLGDGVIRKETIVEIDFSPLVEHPELGSIFTLQTSSGTTYYSRTAVLAVGSGSAPRLPQNLDPGISHHCLSSSIGQVSAAQLEGVCHSLAIRQFPDPSVMAKMRARKATCVLVIGGGLTSAQLSHLAVRRGVTLVFHVMRSDFKVKPFDVDLKWMAKFRNREKAAFWSGDSDAERFNAIESARGGGSINPPFANLLKEHVRKGRVQLLQHTIVTPVHFNRASCTWHVRTEPPDQKLDAAKIDYIYFATGVTADFEKIECLKTIRRRFPLHGHGGLPCLAEDLEWWGKDASRNSVIKKGEAEDWNKTNFETDWKGSTGETTNVGSFMKPSRETSRSSSSSSHAAIAEPGLSYSSKTPDRESSTRPTESKRDSAGSSERKGEVTTLPSRIPLFITGRLAGLRLGPGAGNFEGARLGAERIALGIEEYLAETDEQYAGAYHELASIQAKVYGDRVALKNEVRLKERKSEDKSDQMYRFVAGIGSRFESLAPDSKASNAEKVRGNEASQNDVELEFNDLFVG